MRPVTLPVVICAWAGQAARLSARAASTLVNVAIRSPLEAVSGAESSRLAAHSVASALSDGNALQSVHAADLWDSNVHKRTRAGTALLCPHAGRARNLP